MLEDVNFKLAFNDLLQFGIQFVDMKYSLVSMNTSSLSLTVVAVCDLSKPIKFERSVASKNGEAYQIIEHARTWQFVHVAMWIVTFLKFDQLTVA